MAGERRVDWQKARDLCVKLYMARGIPEADAYMISDNLILAELSGVYSHGLTRMNMYMRYIDNGQANISGEIKVLNEGPATLLIDGNNCLGTVVATKAVRRGIEKARGSGAVIVSVRKSNHFGIAAYYTQMITEQGMLGIAATNAFPHVAPWGSYKGYFGTNPISFGAPTMSGKPIILDMATSVVARGKISVAAKEGKSIPLGWALDAYGNPTTDAAAAVKGVLLPIAGPKGYGLSLFIDILSGVLSGAKFGGYLGPTDENTSKDTDVGHFFVIIDISRFMNIEDFNKRIEIMIKDIKALPKVDGVDEIFMPGEIEQRKTEINKREGLLLNELLQEDLKRLCERFDVKYSL